MTGEPTKWTVTWVWRHDHKFHHTQVSERGMGLARVAFERAHPEHVVLWVAAAHSKVPSVG